MIDYSDLVRNEFKTADCYFDHEKRVIRHKVFPIENNLYLYLFLDEQLKVREDADYLSRIKTHPEKYDIETYHAIKDRYWHHCTALEFKHSSRQHLSNLQKQD